MTERQGKIFSTVARHVESVTRFEVADLTELNPEREQLATVTFDLVQEADIRITVHKGHGRLPNGVDLVPSNADANKELQLRLRTARERVPAGLQKWIHEDDGSYMRLLPSSFIALPRCAGCQYQCGVCHGACVVTCTNCRRGRVSCHQCHGRCHVDCSSCNGSGKLFCHSCAGSGQYSTYVNGRTVYQHCLSCHGSGRSTCYSCSASGTVTCRTCNGYGDLQCGVCGGTAQVTCDHCVGTGLRHEYGSIDCNVAVHKTNHRVSAFDQDGCDQLGAIDVRQLPELGNVSLCSHEPQALGVRTAYQVQLLHQKTCLKANGEDFTIYGFGPHAQVRDFRNIAGHLLQSDLDQLLDALRQGKHALFGHQGQVLEVLSVFSRSELNVLIAESVTGEKPGADLYAEVQSQFRGLVSESYVATASGAFRQSLQRIYRAQVNEPGLALAGIAFLLALFSSWLHWPSPNWLACASLSLAVCGLLWLAAEIQARGRIAGYFEKMLGQRILNICKRSPGIKRWRRGVWMAIAASSLAGAYVSPHLAGADQALQAWMRTW